MVTRSGWLLLMGSVVTVVAGRAFALPELYLLGATGAALLLAAFVLVRRPPPNLDVERTVHPPRVHLGGQSRVELCITNRSLRRAPVVTLHDPVEGTVGARVSLAPLDPGEDQAASYRLPTERRGIVRVGPLEAQVTDAFGLVRRCFAVAGDATLTVLPAIENLGGLASGGGLDDPLAGIAHPVLGSLGDEDFATLRPYVVGDDLRRVHWASSARAGDLLVRQDDPPWQGHLTVVLDAREERLDADQFEVAVSAAASLVNAIAVRGDRARLIITNGTDTGLLDARAGRDTLLEHLAVVKLHQGGELPEPALDGRSRTGGLILVTGTPNGSDLARLVAQRSRFATIRLVIIDPSVIGGARQYHPTANSPGVEAVVVDRDHPFGEAWRESMRRTAVRR